MTLAEFLENAKKNHRENAEIISHSVKTYFVVVVEISYFIAKPTGARFPKKEFLLQWADPTGDNSIKLNYQTLNFKRDPNFIDFYFSGAGENKKLIACFEVPELGDPIGTYEIQFKIDLKKVKQELSSIPLLEDPISPCPLV